MKNAPTLHFYAQIAAGWQGYLTASDESWTLFFAEDGTTYLHRAEVA